MSNLSLKEFGLPSPSNEVTSVSVNREYLKELSYDVVQLSESVHENTAKLNSEQRQVYNEVLIALIQVMENCSFWTLLVGQKKRF